MAEREKHLPVYEINDNVFLVEGAARAAIYDTPKGNVFSVNNQAREIILGHQTDAVFSQQLIEAELIVPEKPVIESVAEPPPLGLEFLWLSLTSRCNLTCIHCYQESTPDLSEDKLTLADWKLVIKQAASVGCKQLQFIGGEPLTFSEIFKLAAYARQLNYEFLEIFTNGTLLNPARVQAIKDLGIKVAISLYSNIPKVHDAITTKQGSYEKTVKAMQFLREAGIQTRIGVVVMKNNQHTMADALKMVKDFGFDGGDSADVVRPLGRGRDNRILPDENYIRKFGIMTRPVFVTDPISFNRNRFYNPCWAGKLAVDSSGDISPCITAKLYPVGETHQSIGEVVESPRVRELWSISKDKIESCSLCEYRYACGDCRPLAAGSAEGNLYCKTARCTYNPLTGEWL